MDVQSAIGIVGGLMGIAGTIAALFAFTFKRGGQEAVSQQTLEGVKREISSFRELLEKFTTATEGRHKDIEVKLDKRINEIDMKLDKRIYEVDSRFKDFDLKLDGRHRDLDQRIGALAAADQLAREQRAEDRQFLLEHYMKVEDIDKIEHRVLKNQDKLFAQLDRLEQKLDAIGEPANMKLIPHRSS